MVIDSTQNSPAGDIWEVISNCSELPSPPGISVKLINLAQRQDANFEDVEELVKLDPVISAKLLRLANSSFYARDRKIENIRQAISQFGLNGTLIIALTFSLIKKPKSESMGLDYNRYWLRSLAAGIICKKLSILCSAGAPESFYLAGLLQDIGILALATVKQSLYEYDSTQPLTHHELIVSEKDAIGIDHSEIGGWLLEKWQFPQLYVDATRTSHALKQKTAPSELPLLSACVAVSSYLADLWSLPVVELPPEIGPIITNQLELDDEAIRSLLTTAQSEIGEVAELFDLTSVDGAAIDTILSKAKESLTLRTLLSEQTLTETNSKIARLEEHNVKLERRLDYDELTGVYTRAFAYSTLNREFPVAVQQQSPIALVFVDLDDFKRINDQHGHSVGDKVLKLAAKSLKESTRESDIVARVGGEEFLIIMLNTGYLNASSVCERIVNQLARTYIQLDRDIELRLTASVGLSVHGEETQFSDFHSLIDSADMACYRAKNGGKNRWIFAAA